ncbi:flagellar biosynthetic protein FliO [Nitrospirillum sp. BR 11828]|uniref:FliO/MopB family protein n=1 Tax=Nitrospirillum sp. BR 11828 TaxID=3104325 RepID=UPI002ACA9124|nr:flagellar biosynthetic protein FliO [Nitrospirillum sp. BR 11828]MDZ5648186.1 flagellar biosynthetic protein FliO [Nitrospirillum sp. BR 11828]
MSAEPMVTSAAYYLYAALMLGLVLGFILVAGWLVRRFGGGALLRLPGRTQRRLGVVEAMALDPRRRLVLIRRDGVEHLLLLGGTQDLHLEGPFPATGPNTGDSHQTFQTVLNETAAPPAPAPGP